MDAQVKRPMKRGNRFRLVTRAVEVEHPMHPNPIAETVSPCDPNVRCSMCPSFGVSDSPDTQKMPWINGT
jgi:hypothetical protein